MNARLARFIVRAAAWLAPKAIRTRWREEWLAELSASGKYARAVAAPRDAIAAHRLARIHRSGEARGARLAGWASDCRHAVRSLRRSPGHLLTVTLCLGAGLVATFSVFSIVNTALHGELPGIADRERLGTLFVRTVMFRDGTRFGEIGMGRFAAPHHDLLRRHAPSVAGVAAEAQLRVAVRLPDGEVTSVRGAFVSGDYFDVAGSRPTSGRLLDDADAADQASVVVVSHRLWQRHFAGRVTFTSEQVLVAGRAMAIIGVAPEGFQGLEAATPEYIEDNRRDVAVDIWLPMTRAADWSGTTLNYRLFVRAAPGRSLVDAQRDLQASVTALEALAPPGNTVWRFDNRENVAVVRPLGRHYNQTDAMMLALVSMLLAAPMLVLGIACANAANLRLARFVSQHRELAVRLSLGGSRPQVLRLLVIETAILAALAAFVGWAGSEVLLWRFGSFLPGGAQMDYRVFVFGIALVAVTIGLSGLGPGWLATRRLAAAGLRQTPQAGGFGHTRLRHALVVVQVALSLVLLVTGALFTRSVQAMIGATPPGLDELLVADLDFSQVAKQPAEIRRLLDLAVQRLGSDGRARAVAAADIGLYGTVSGPAGNEAQYLKPGDPATARQWARVGHVTPEWFRAMGLELRGGRTFRADEAGPVAVVNRTLADRFGGPSPLGLTLRIRPSDPKQASLEVQVIGIAADAPRRPDRPTSEPAIYLPMREPAGAAFTLFVRAADPDAVIRDFQAAVSGIDPRAPWSHFETAESRLERDLDPFRQLARSVASLGVMALLLAMAGLYAVIAYVVSLRTHEIAVRVAIGARASDVVGLVLRQALRLVAGGVVVGLAVVLPLVWMLEAMFVGVSPLDPLAIVPAAALLLMASVVAAGLPARRAARIDPVGALRES
jgi:predicted permease